MLGHQDGCDALVAGYVDLVGLRPIVVPPAEGEADPGQWAGDGGGAVVRDSDVEAGGAGGGRNGVGRSVVGGRETAERDRGRCFVDDLRTGGRGAGSVVGVAGVRGRDGVVAGRQGGGRD